MKIQDDEQREVGSGFEAAITEEAEGDRLNLRRVR